MISGSWSAMARSIPRPASTCPLPSLAERWRRRRAALEAAFVVRHPDGDQRGSHQRRPEPAGDWWQECEVDHGERRHRRDVRGQHPDHVIEHEGPGIGRRAREVPRMSAGHDGADRAEDDRYYAEALPHGARLNEAKTARPALATSVSSVAV